MCQAVESSSFFLLLPLAVGTVVCGMSLSGVPVASAQPATGPALAPPPAAPPASATRASPLAPGPRVRQETGPAPRQSTPALSASDRWAALRDEVVTPGLLIGSLAIGLSDHLTDAPSSWRGDAVGYAMRTGSTAGRLLIEAGATRGIAAATRLDLRFAPRGTGGIGARLRHAVLGAVTARTAHGTRVPNLPRLLGTYGATLLEHRWAHGESRPWDAALTLVLSLGVDVAANVAAECASAR